MRRRRTIGQDVFRAIESARGVQRRISQQVTPTSQEGASSGSGSPASSPHSREGSPQPLAAARALARAPGRHSSQVTVTPPAVASPRRLEDTPTPELLGRVTLESPPGIPSPGAALLAVRLGDLAVPAAKKGQPEEEEPVGRKVSICESSEGAAEERVEPAVAFWRTIARAGAKRGQLPQPPFAQHLGSKSLDYFLSHTWHPEKGPCDMDAHAHEKAEALHRFGLLEAALGGNKYLETPRFLMSPEDGEKEVWGRSSKAALPSSEEPPWRECLCWVDKACSPTGAGGAGAGAQGGSSAAEAVRVTKTALAACRTFLVVLTTSYFTRLWCVFEWAAFLAQAAPHYRRLELAVPAELLGPQCWPGLLQVVAGFSLAALRTGSDGDHIELWRELEKAVVSTLGFERWVQATALALLARRLLLQCNKHSVAFNSKIGEVPEPLETLAVTCDDLGLPGVAYAVRSASPKAWWQVAQRQARSSGTAKRPAAGGQAEDEGREDAFRRLSRAISMKIQMNEQEEAACQSAGNLPDHPYCSSAEAAAYAMQALARGEDHSQAPALLDVFSWAKDPSRQGELQPPPHALGAANAGAGGARASQQVSPEQPPSAKAPSPQVPDEESPRKTVVLNNQVMVSAWSKVPEGLAPFRRGAQGQGLTAEDRVRAKFFRDAWLAYRQRVDRWFDTVVCPHLEMWRQRGLRSPGALEDTFGTLLLKVAGPLQDVLCERLAPGVREAALAKEKLPRGRPALVCDAPWANPTIDRLLVACQHESRPRLLGGASANDHHGGGGLASVALIASPLPLRLVEHKALMLLCIRLKGGSGDWRRVTISQRLGAAAMVNALRHLTHGAGEDAEVEIEVVVPRLAVEVPGSSGVRVVMGTHASGLMREGTAHEERAHDSESGGHRAGARHASLSSHVVHQASGRTAPESGEEIAPESKDGVDWHLWLCREPSSEEDSGGPQRPGEALAASGPDAVDATAAMGQHRKGQRIPPHVAMPQKPAVPRAAHADLGPTAALEPFWLNPGIRGASRRNPGPGGMLPETAVPTVPMLPPLEAVPKPPASGGTAPAPRAGVGGPRPPPAGLADGARCLRALSERKGRRRLPRMPLSARQAASAPLPAKMPATPTFPEKLPKTLAAWLQDTPPSLPPQRPVALAAGKGLQTRWEWSLRAQGGAPLDAQGGITESVWVGTIPELLSRFMDWLNAATLCHWVPVNGAAAAHGHALLADAGTLEHEPAEERDPVVSTNTREAALPPSFARRDPPCGRCGHADVAAVSLQESMLREIWEVPACKICLACGDVQPLKALDTASARSSAINGDDVMEVSTTAILRLRGSRANEVERLISRTLRVEPGQVSVAAPRNACHGEPTEAKHRVAHISMSSRGAGVATAAAVAKMHRQGGSLMNDGPFSQDQEWVHSCLHDTGLDLIYGDTRPIKVDIAIEELDDRRMLPRRQEVHPLILWAELRHVLGPELNLVTWIHACFAITNGGKFSLPAAIMIKRNIESLRVVTGMVRASTGPERDVPLPAVWPLALHRVLLAREGAAEAVLGRALARAGIESGSGAALCAEGARVLRSLHDRSSKCSSREPGEASTPGAVAGGKNILDEATSVMRELAYRRLHSDAQGHGAAAFRATLRARRQLRQIQVSKYLTGLTQKIFQNDTNWRRRSNGSESVSSVFSEPEEGAAEEEDLGEEGGSEEEMGVESKEAQEEEERRRAAAELAAEEEARHGEELTVQKVLGHAREYVHIRDILQKALEVLFVIVQTFSRFSACIDNASLAKRKSTAMPRLARNLERVLVEQGFVRTALRAVYRHHHRPEICGHALSLLAHLLDGNAMHGCGPRVAAELSEPPERFLTLAAGAGNLSNGGHLGPLRTCLKVLNAVVWPQSEDAAFREPPPMPSGREAEAAEALVGILDRNPDEEDIYIQALHLLSGLVHNSPMCIALIRRGLAETLRRWLSRCAGGAVQEAWRKAARRKSGSQVGPSGRGARALKQMNHALSGIRASVFRSEEIAWDLAANLARGGAGEPNFLEDTRLSVEQALGELRRDPRGSQWAYAVNFLTKLLAFEREMKFSDRAFSAAVLAGGGMQLLRAEFPDGEVPTALPLLREVVCAAGRAPRPPRGHLDVDEQPEDSDVPSNAEALESAASLQSTASLPSVTTTAAEAKDWLVRHQGVNWLLEAMHKHTKADIHCGLLRIMGELFEAGQPVSSLAATTFRDYRGRKGVSLSNILKAMRKSFHSVELVDAALHTLHGVLAVDKQLAIVLGNLGDGCPCLVDVVWGNLGHRRLRVRALALLKTVCEAVPEKTERIAAIWQEKSQPHGVCRGPSAPPEETGEQDGAASPHGREGSGSASNGGSASSAEEQAEEAYRSVEEAGSNTEEASSSAVDDEVEAGSSTAEADVEVGSNAELPPTGKATADPVPRDVQRFGALLTVHQYDRSKGQGSVQDVMKAMREFDGNQEICALGLASMLKGANMDVKKRITALLEAPFNFSNTMRRIVVHFPITAIVLDAMRLLTGILLTKPEHPNEYVEVLALAASTLLEVPPQWTAAEWEVLILAFETVNGHVLGRTALAQFELHSRTAEEWEKFMHKEDEASRTIVRKYKGETERTLGIYR